MRGEAPRRRVRAVRAPWLGRAEHEAGSGRQPRKQKIFPHLGHRDPATALSAAQRVKSKISFTTRPSAPTRRFANRHTDCSSGVRAREGLTMKALKTIGMMLMMATLAVTATACGGEQNVDS